MCMISINTNLSSLIVRSNLAASTNGLNQAIERMTSGFKINGAKDNAAGYSISERMNSQISSYEVAEDNASVGLDIVETASSSLALIEDRLSRLRMLQKQAMNGTYGEESLEAINQECDSLVDEINRLYLNTEYNGINLFLDSSDGRVRTTNEYYEMNASLSTTFEQLEITSGNFTVYDKQGGVIGSYTVDKDDNIGDFFDLLSTHNIQGSISRGVITLESGDGNYIEGDLADALGISTSSITIIESSTQSSSGSVTYTETKAAEGTTTLDVLGVSGGVISVKDKQGGAVGTVTLNSSDTIDAMFSKLSTLGIDGKIENGVITLTSASGNYAEGDVLSSLGIGTHEGARVTITQAASMSSVIGDVYSGSSYNITVLNQKTGAEEVFTLSGTDSFADMRDEFASRGMTMSITDGVLSLSSSDNSLIAKGSILNSFGMSEVANGTYTITTANSMTSPTINYTMTIQTTTTTETKMGGSFLQGVNHIDTGGMQSVSEVNFQSLSNKTGTFAVRSTADLDSMAAQISYIDGGNYTFVLSNNIDYQRASWTPIGGTSTTATLGNFTFDGNGYVISNVHTGLGELTDVGGLFNCIDNVTIKNLGIEGWITGDNTDYTGAIVNYAVSSSINNCYFNGTIAGSNKCAGGLVGYADDITMQNCYSEGYVGGIHEVGGLIGHLTTGLISRSYSGAEVVGHYSSQYSRTFCGGLIGCAEPENFNYGDTFITIEQAYTTGSVEGHNVGGLIGLAEAITFIDVYCANSEIWGSFQSAALLGSSASTLLFYGDTYILPELHGSNIDGLILAESAGPDITISSLYTSCSGIDLTPLNIGGISVLETHTCAQSDIPYSYTPTAINETVTTTVSTTSMAELTAMTKLADLGAGSGVLTLGSGTTINYSASDTVTDFINKLSTYGITATVNNGRLSITQTGNAFIKSDSGQLFNKLGIDLSQSFSTSQEPLYANSSSNRLEAESVTTSKTNTASNPLGEKQTPTITGATTLNTLGINSDIKISIDGKVHNINVDRTTTIDDFITQLQELGINAELTNGVLELSGSGDIRIQTSSVVSAFQLGQVVQTEELSKENTESNQLVCEVELTPPEAGNAYAPGSFILQVGIDSSESSKIEIETALGLNQIELLRGIGLDNNDYLSVIDDMLNIVSAKQTELGAVQNRLESALEEISIHYENLVSSRSTIRDADIAEESSEYIKMQILQQASATLLATANQTPSIALQLL